ncbi:MAG: DUF3108 domain-containing protein [Calditerrivibrio sp.]|nr:DUF3108 domain-containing protein [Calditerrivibrio sp.]
MRFLLILLILIFPYITFSEELKLCYDVKAFFVKIGETCIFYDKKDELLYFNSYIRSSELVSFIKRINDTGKGIADLKKFAPIYFLFDQEESTYKATNEYFYQHNKIISKTIKYDKSWQKKEEEIKEFVETEYFEPFMLSMVFYKNVKNNKLEPLKLFYKNKTYNIPYKILGNELVEINNKSYNTIKTSVTPFIKGKGLLIPDGEWFIFLDKENLYPIKIEAKFIIAKATAYLSKESGDKSLIKKILEHYSK